jgi:hypothetical protein
MAGAGNLLGRRGITANGSRSEWPTLASFPSTTTTGTDTTPVITETYIGEVYVANNCEATGVSLLNGSAVAGNVKLALYDGLGNVVAQTASTAQAGTAALQAVAFTAVAKIKGPATYFVGVQCSSTSARIRTHTLGVMAAAKKAGETYGTVTPITPPTTFTTALGPIASLY